MALFPFNTNWPRRAQSDVPGIRTVLGAGVCYAPGNLAASDDDRFVVAVDMKVGAYALAETTMPEAAVARKLLIAVTQDAPGGNDTMGTLTIVGTDIAGQPLTETIAPAANTTKTTLNAFKTVESITGAGWARDGAAGSEDTIKIGTSEAFGLPDLLTDTAQVVCASLNNVREAVAPTVTVSATVLALNTVDLATTPLTGTPVKVYYWL
ncbi:MAG TPA: hypothetical protein PLJ35_15750 [Anaerolineae bacterium]|nr:hypothetical protein [Anaerolineae bacterium]HOR00265.1 hypothetical protein [Anaerolineae bacterium]HPL29302.1 hypothetical protein [Anaerolineae bacterium]